MSRSVEIPLLGLRGRDGNDFFPSQSLVEAANVAIALEVPLLLTGEPGCGKTDFAFAVARYLAGSPEGWDSDELLQCYVRSDTTSKDLLYTYDAIRRFGDAHHGSPGEKVNARDARRYIDLRPLGRALASKKRPVLLVDEIDKAPRDLPNDLLRELDQGRFEIPEIPDDAATLYADFKTELAREMGYPRRRHGSPELPVIIVTSNEERQLPNAFLRRCAFCHIDFPEQGALQRILETRFPEDRYPRLISSVRAGLVRSFTGVRGLSGLLKKPGTSELIAWAQSLLTVLPAADLDRAASFEPKDGKWAELPGQMCLLKLREDLGRLRR